ncbi:tRNA pseudouridine(38-40) synthase TruA [Guggenheimella bovis]
MFKLILGYDGRGFFGSQRQLSDRTVQSVLEDTLSMLFKEEVKVQLASRTDRGVHAIYQVASVTLGNAIPPEKLTYALNRALPMDLKVFSTEVVEDSFHPRFDAKRKVYEYTILFKDDLFKRPYAWIIEEPLDVKAMRNASKSLVGTHDFFSFSNRRKGEGSTIRTIYSIDLKEVDGGLVIRYEADGFLYKMVRILTHFLVEVGKGNVESEMVETILKEHSRRLTRKVAPAEGLLLKEIHYD